MLLDRVVVVVVVVHKAAGAALGRSSASPLLPHIIVRSAHVIGSV